MTCSHAARVRYSPRMHGCPEPLGPKRFAGEIRCLRALKGSKTVAYTDSWDRITIAGRQGASDRCLHGCMRSHHYRWSLGPPALRLALSAKCPLARPLSHAFGRGASCLLSELYIAIFHPTTAFSHPLCLPPTTMAPLSSILLLVLPAFYWIVNTVRVAYFSSLARVPNAHPIVPLSRAWLWYCKWKGIENRQRRILHDRLGPVVRVGPRELSVNCIDNGIKTVFGGGFEKPASLPPLFSLLDSKAHAEQRRYLSGVYSKTSILASPDVDGTLRAVIDDSLMPQFAKWASLGEAIDVHPMNKAYAFDATASYIFGTAQNPGLTIDKPKRNRMIHAMENMTDFRWWKIEFNQYLQALRIYRSPTLNATCRATFEDLVADMCTATARSLEDPLPIATTSSSGGPVVYQRYSEGISKGPHPPSVKPRAVACEMLDHILASTEASGSTLTFLIHEMSQQPDVMTALRQEIRSLAPVTTPVSMIPARSLDGLQLLDAVVIETLRKTGSPGPFPRVVPEGGARIGDYANIPGGTIVSASTWALHWNADVYEDPDKWMPRRWLTTDEEKRKEMHRWFWAFGSGSRMCVGSHFAMRSLKTMVASIYQRYTTEIVDDEGMEPLDAFITGPTGNKLIVKFHLVN
ncbi:hypothetical protein MRB53_036937 [Persea americana]|nr:hypothetical protein MRB53_036937 [Persea americana]